MEQKWDYYNMKHLKKFESNMLNITYINMEWMGNTCLAIYIGDKLERCEIGLSDVYRNKKSKHELEIMCDGIEFGLSYYNKLNIKEHTIEDEKYKRYFFKRWKSNKQNILPKDFSEIEYLITGKEMGLL